MGYFSAAVYTLWRYVLSVPRDVALEILWVATGACSYWSRPVVAETDSASGRPSKVAFTDDSGVNRIADVDQVARAAGEWAKGASGALAAALRDGEAPVRYPAADVDQIVQTAVFGAERY